LGNRSNSTGARFISPGKGFELSDQDQIPAKRKAAARARRLAQGLLLDEDRTRMLQLAAQLDAEADALEGKAQGQRQTTAAPEISDQDEKR